MASLFASRATMVGFSPRQVDLDIEWESDGAHLLRSFAAATGPGIRVDPGVQRTVLDLMARAAPAFAKSANRHLVPVARQAFDLWPVRTGLSKSLLSLEANVSSDGAEIDVRLVNRAPYAAFIGRGQVVQELVFTPGREAAEAMADDLAEEIVR